MQMGESHPKSIFTNESIYLIRESAESHASL